MPGWRVIAAHLPAERPGRRGRPRIWPPPADYRGDHVRGEMSDVTRAIAAATSVAPSLGLPASDAIVVHNSNRLALRLTPCDVLARVAPGGHEAAQFEVELAQRLAE